MNKWIFILSLIGGLNVTLNAQIDQLIIDKTITVNGTPAAGYIFISPFTRNISPLKPNAIEILDALGEPVFYAKMSNQNTAPFMLDVMFLDFDLRSDSTVSFFGRKAINGNLAAGSRKIYQLDTLLNLKDSIECIGGQLDAHDYLLMPNGDQWYACDEKRPADLSAYTTVNGIQGGLNGEILGQVIKGFNAAGQQIFNWNTIDEFSLSDMNLQYFLDPNLLDHAHINSLDIDTDGNLIVSFRHHDEITKINTDNGQIMWRFGGVGNQFNVLNDTVPFSGQHDAKILSNGRLSLFDNSSNSSVLKARAIEYSLDDVNMTAQVEWQYNKMTPSRFMGSSQNLPNGNRLIGWGGLEPFNISPEFTEVDSNGNVLLEISFEEDFLSYRARKRILPFNLNRPEITCDQSTQTLSAPPGYDVYSWSTGDTTQTIPITAPGSYHVWVNQGIGFLRSSSFSISDLNNMCATIDVVDHIKPKKHIYPNPVINEINVYGEENDVMRIFQVDGQLVGQFQLKKGNNNIKLNNMSPGIYVVKTNTQHQTFIKL